MKFNLRIPVFISFLLAGLCFPQIQTAAVDQNDNKVAEPTTVEEGLVQLEKVLGRYDPDDHVEWRLPTDFENKQRPNPSEPEVLIVFKGLRVIGHPFRGPESISFDDIWQWERQVYDLAEDGKKTLTRKQRSHNVSRYTLSLNSGLWLVSGSMLSNGVHRSIGRSAFQGIVKWHPDGFEFVGSSGIGRYYAAGGKFTLGTDHGSTRYVREGTRLLIKTRSHSYRLATDAAGTLLTAPDFKLPFGSPFEVDYRSEPLTGDMD